MGETRGKPSWSGNWISRLSTLHNWPRRGWVHAHQCNGGQSRWSVWADEDELARLRALRATREAGASSLHHGS